METAAAAPTTGASTGGESAASGDNTTTTNTDRILKIDHYCAVFSTLSTALSKEQEEQLAKQLAEVNENLEHIIAVPPLFSSFYKHALPLTLNFLLHGPKNFLAEHSGHQIRKHLLEILLRVPFKENGPHLNQILPCIYHVIENDNEQNANIALRIVYDVHRKMGQQKTLQSKMVEEAKSILSIFRKMALSFLQNVTAILEPRPPFPELTPSQLDIPSLLSAIFYATELVIEGSNCIILPRGLYSLKMLTEVPLFVIFLSNYYKDALTTEVWELVRLVARIISQQPTPEQLANPRLKKECYLDYITAQAKALCLIGFFAKGHEGLIAGSALTPPFMSDSPAIVLNLLRNCPPSAPHIRKEILGGLRALINTSIRTYFIPEVEQLFDDEVLIGSGWTARAALRSYAYGIIYDLVHHVRTQLNATQIQATLNYFTANIFDERLCVFTQIMTCRLMLNLADSYMKLMEKESGTSVRVPKMDMETRAFLLKIFYLFAGKVEYLAKYILPILVQRTASNPPPTLPPPTTVETLAELTSEGGSGAGPGTASSSDSSGADFGEPPPSSGIAENVGSPLCTEDCRIKFGFPSSADNYTLAEAKMYFKALISGLKVVAVKMKDISDRVEMMHNNTVMQAVANQQQQQQAAAAAVAAAAGGTTPTTPQPAPATPAPSNLILIRTGFARPRDLAMLISLFKYGIKLFDIYALQAQIATATLSAGQQNQQQSKKLEVDGGLAKEKDKESKTGSTGNVSILGVGGDVTSGKVPGLEVKPTPAHIQSAQQRTKEEKELIECFTGIFLTLPPQTFRFIMRHCMEHLVTCISENASLILFVNNFITKPQTSFIFTNLLVEFLLARMEVMGNGSPEQSSLYLKLFKLVFGSVSIFPADNELMLKPHLRSLVDNSMKMALEAKDPFNYFQLLRALFRSIGGGSHDLLYQEFLPMLPSLLQGLNRLQAATHRQNMRDLFVELCLTIPVRLSSLLPYLPWLMDPLVAALNGTPSLISQGLRTLELCVDNLQPDFLYEHIQPIRSQLMQALWRTLRHPVEQIASGSLRILGKLGGASHKMMIEPQRLEWTEVGGGGEQNEPEALSVELDETISPANIPRKDAYSFITMYFAEAGGGSQNLKSAGQPASPLTPVYLPIDKVIETAYTGLRQPGTDSFYRQQCWEVIKSFFVANVETICSPEEKALYAKLFGNSSLTTGDLPRFPSTSSSGSSATAPNSTTNRLLYKYSGEKERHVHQLALTALLTAAAIKELHNSVLSFIISLARHYTLVAIVQQVAGSGSGLVWKASSTSGTSSSSSGSGGTGQKYGMDPLVLVDAIATVMGQEETELVKPCQLVIRLMTDTAETVLGGKERANTLPLFEYLLQKLTTLCYEPPWFSKNGGCQGIRALIKSMSLRWLLERQLVILKAMLFVLGDLSAGLCCGVSEMAKETLDLMVHRCAAVLELEAPDQPADLVELQKSSTSAVIQELLRLVTSSNTVVREEAMHLLRLLAEVTGQSVSQVILPHKDRLAEHIPLKRHKLPFQPPAVQIGLLDGMTFCMTLQPPLFSLDAELPEHLTFFEDVKSIADSREAELRKHQCYKGLDSLVPLKKSALKCLAACSSIPSLGTKVFEVLYRALHSSDAELQKCAFHCLEGYKNRNECDQAIIRNGIRAQIRNIADHRTLTAPGIIRLQYFARLFTYIFNDRFCEQFLRHLNQITESVVAKIRTWKSEEHVRSKLAASGQSSTQQQPATAKDKMVTLDVQTQLNVCIEIINLFTEITAADAIYVDHLLRFLLRVESLLDTYGAVQFYEPVRRFMRRYPAHSVALLEKYYHELSVSRYLFYLFDGEEGGAPFRAVLYADPAKLKTILSGQTTLPAGSPQRTTERAHALIVLNYLRKYNPKWLSEQPELVASLRQIWSEQSFPVSVTSNEAAHWSEPQYVVKCLLAVFKANPEGEIDTLYGLLKAFDARLLTHFECLKKFLSQTVMKNMETSWKRAAFRRFIELYREAVAGSETWSQEVVAKILQYVIIPIFAYAFDAGEAEQLLGPSAHELLNGTFGISSPNVNAANNTNTDPKEDLVYVLATSLVTENAVDDGLRLYVLQLIALILEQAPVYVRGQSTVKRSEKSSFPKDEYDPIRLLMNYAWFCMANNATIQADPATNYYGHLVLTVFINRMAIHKRIVRNVFVNLMQASTVEARPVVRAALELVVRPLTRSQKDGKAVLAAVTRQSITEEVQQAPGLGSAQHQAHLLFPYQTIVRHYRHYYEARHTLMPHLVGAINRLGLSNSLEHRRMALDLVEVIIRWEYTRKKDELERGTTGRGRAAGLVHQEASTSSGASGPSQPPTSEREIILGAPSDPITKEYATTIVNFLVHFTCLLNDNLVTSSASNPGIPGPSQNIIQVPGQNSSSSASIAPITPEYLGKRALALLQIIFQVDLWPTASFRPAILERALNYAKEAGSAGVNSICAALELLTVFLQTMKKDPLLNIFTAVQKSISSACANPHTRVVRTMHALLCKLMALFPPNLNTNSSLSNQLEPLEQMYTDIHSTILAGFGAYDRALCITTGQPTTPGSQLGPEITRTLSALFGTLMILKAACLNQAQYIDRLLTPFIHMLQKLAKEHLILARILPKNAQTPTEAALNGTLAIELIVLSLALVKGRLMVMTAEMRRTFLNNVLITLIDQTVEVKVMRMILQLLEEWIKQPLAATNSAGGGSGSSRPSGTIGSLVREKLTLLTRISINIEKRMAGDLDLNGAFLDLIYYIYTDDTLRTSDLLAVKLEPAFMAGLRCPQPAVRAKFFAILDGVLRRRLFDRLLYIICEQNWETAGFWIRQALELLLTVAETQVPLSNPKSTVRLPLPMTLVTSISGDDLHHHHSMMDSSSMMVDDMLMDFDFSGSHAAHMAAAEAAAAAAAARGRHSEDVEMTDVSGSAAEELPGSQSRGSAPTTSATAGTQPAGHKQGLVYKVADFLLHLQQIKAAPFLTAVIQLCHLDSTLAAHLWIQLFPRIYAILGSAQQQLLALQLAPFLVSGSHLTQRDASISALGTLFEAVTCCRPTITLRPSVLRYIAKSHNAWHRVILGLEQARDSNDPKDGGACVGLGGLLMVDGSVPVSTSLATSYKPTPSHTKKSRSSSAAAAAAAEGATPTQQNPAEAFPAELNLPSTSYRRDCSTVLWQIYEQLREEDYWTGIWQEEANFDETRLAIAYEQLGHFEEANAAYELAMSKARASYGPGNPAPYNLRDEYCLWEQHWIRCCKELNQWDFLIEYAKNPEAKNPQLAMDSAWRIPDWEAMHEAIAAVEQAVASEQLWKLAMYKGYDAIFFCNGGKGTRELEQVQKMVDLATASLIKEWRRLPPLVSAAHVDILNAANRVMELQEGGLLHQAMLNGGTNPATAAATTLGPSGHQRTTPQDLKSIIKTWKNRLPVISDDLSHWSDIFTWRQHHYQAVLGKFEADLAKEPTSSFASQNLLVAGHASAQSLILYAKIARKHGLAGVSMEALQRIHTIPKVPIIDCFQKIRQQLKCHLLLHHRQPTGEEIEEGLSVIESTHLKYFQRDMIAEFYALKGHFLALLGQLEEANCTFSVATQMHDTLVKAWALWGEYYEELFTGGELTGGLVPFADRKMEYGKSAIIAYLHACRHQNEAKARKYLSRVLWLQSFDDAQGTLARVTDTYNIGVPPINWLPWVPQLITCMTRPEGGHLNNLITQLSKFFPQAMYYPLRTLIQSLRMEAQIKYKTILQKTSYAPPSHDAVLQASPVLMSVTKMMHYQKEQVPTVLTSLEFIADQLQNLKENSFEDILKQLRQVLTKCYVAAFENRDNVAGTPIPPQTATFVRKLSNALSAGAGAASGGDQATTSTSSSARRGGGDSSMISGVKNQFTLDFANASSQTLQEMIFKVKKWIKLLEAKSKIFPTSCLLEERCRYLAAWSNQQMVDVALPGELFLPTISVIYIAKFCSRVEVVKKHGVTARRFAIRGTNGKVYPYLVINDSSNNDARREERFLQLQRLLNLYLGKHKETARRVLHFPVPRVVPFSPSLRIVEDYSSSLSLLDIYRAAGSDSGSSSTDAPIARYYERLAMAQTKGTGSEPSVISLALLKDIFKDIQSSTVPKTAITDWASVTYSSAVELWHFRKQLTQQLALAATSQYAFHLTRLNPEMMYIVRDSGQLGIAYYRFDLSEGTGELEGSSKSAVPFRLTPALEHFITSIGIHGPFSAAMISTATCLTSPNYKVRSILNVVLRDEIIHWYRRAKSTEQIVYIVNKVAARMRTSGEGGTSGAEGGGASGGFNQTTIATLLAQAADIPEVSGEELVHRVNGCVGAIMSRLTGLTNFDGAESKARQLITQATAPENLARMDPVWYPWL